LSCVHTTTKSFLKTRFLDKLSEIHLFKKFININSFFDISSEIQVDRESSEVVRESNVLDGSGIFRESNAPDGSGIFREASKEEESTSSCQTSEASQLLIVKSQIKSATEEPPGKVRFKV